MKNTLKIKNKTILKTMEPNKQNGKPNEECI